MLRNTFSALSDRRFAVFLGGQWLSWTGNWMERSALAALVYELSGHQEVWLGYVGAVPVIPVMLLSIPAGAWVDRVDVRRLVLTTQIAMMTLALGLAAAAAAGVLRPWHVLLYAALASACFAVDAPARHALVPRIVPAGTLTNAFALSAAAFNTARLLGGFAFWFVMSATDWGEPGCFWANGLSFLVPIAGLLWIRERPREATAPHPHGDDLHSGLRFAWRTPPVRGALLLLVASGFLGFQVSHLIPVYAEKVWDIGKPGQGTLHAWFGVGALLGGLTLAARHGHIHRGRLIVRRLYASAALLVLFALSPTDQVGRVLLAGAGFLLIQTHSAANALIQTTAPDALRGRVAALFTLSVLGSFPLGGFFGGTVASLVGAPMTTCIDAVLLAAAAFAVSRSHPVLRETA